MTTFSFSLRLAGVDIERGDYEDAFYGAGCDDALLSVVDGGVSLDFDRDAPSYEEAVESAIRDAERAGARVIEVELLPE